MSTSVLQVLSLRHDEDTANSLLAHFWRTETLLDANVVEKHVINQPLLAATLLLLTLFATFLFVFSLLFVGCRMAGKCGAQRYQAHPTSGRHYAFHVLLFFVSWSLMAAASLYFVISGAALWNQPTNSSRLPKLHTFNSSTFYQNQMIIAKRFKREKAGKPGDIGQLFDDPDYHGDFESFTDARSSLPTSTLRSIPIRRLTSTAQRITFDSNPPQPIEIPMRPRAEVEFSQALTRHNLWDLDEDQISAERRGNSIKKVEQESSKALSPKVTIPSRPALFVANEWHLNGGFDKKRKLHSLSTASFVPSSRTQFMGDEKGPEGSQRTNSEDGDGQVLMAEDVAAAVTPELIEHVEYDVSPSSDDSDLLAATNPPTNQKKVTVVAPAATTVEDAELSHENDEPDAEAEYEVEETTTSNPKMVKSAESEYDLIISSETETPTPTTAGRTQSSSAPTTHTTTEYTTILPTISNTHLSSEQTTTVAQSSPETTASTTKKASPPTTTTHELPTSQTPKEFESNDWPTSRTTATTLRRTTTTVKTTQTTKATTAEQITTKSPKVTTSVGDWSAMKDKKLNETLANVSWQIVESATRTTTKKVETKTAFPVEHIDVNEDSWKLLQSKSTKNEYAFRELHTPGIVWMSRLALIFTILLISFVVLPSLFFVISGTICYVYSYHPMDRSALSDKVGQVLVIYSVVLLFSIPCLLVYASFALFYTHCHEALCASVQLQYQHQLGLVENNEQKLLERNILNIEQCRKSLAPVEGLLLSSLLFCLSAMPCVFAMLKLSKYYLRMKTEYYWAMGDNYGRHLSPGEQTIFARNKLIKLPPPKYESGVYGPALYNEDEIYGAYTMYGQI